MKCGLLGETLRHSFSVEIHGMIGKYDYELMEVPPQKIDEFFAAADFDGINVTIPYKQTVIPYLDGISERAKAIGAVNTIVKRDGKLYGDNTDFGGLQALIMKMGLCLSGKTVLIAGTGGTSRTAQAVAEAMGAARVLKISRSGREGALTYEEAYQNHADAEILINTTPAGMYPDMDGMPVDLSRLPALSGIVDVVYNPLETRLVREGRMRGIPSGNGLYMLTAQAVLASEVFTGEEAGQDLTDRIYRELLINKQNIVLTGMPGSGKSTIGKILARKTGRELCDMDTEIVERAGMPITEIFRRDGEKYFRDLETEVLRDLSVTGGKIISTGGGAVLRAENVRAMKANGKVIFLDRDPGELKPAKKRPLADEAEKIRKLYHERLPVYKSTADVTVTVEGRPEYTADRVWNAFANQ